MNKKGSNKSAIMSLHTLAFRLSPEVERLPFSYRVLSFPKRWAEILDDLRAAIKTQRPHQYGPRVKSLEQLALALFSPLITADRRPRSGTNWLYSASDIEKEHIQIMYSTWIAGEYKGLGVPLPGGLDKEIFDEQISWREETRDLAEFDINQWGTAEPRNNKSFDLIPELLASSLSQRGVKFDYGSKILEFRRAPSLSNGVELISWPPLSYEQSAYSIYLRFTLQTVPFQPFPVIHCNMGTRRWVSAPNPWLGGEDHSVYLLTSLPGVKAGQHTQRFQKALVRRRKISKDTGQDNGQSEWQTVWIDHLPELFATIHPRDRLPTAEQIMQSPLNFLGERGLGAALAFSNTMSTRQLKVQLGLMPPDRSQLTRQIAEHLNKLGFVHTERPQRVIGIVAPMTKNVFFPPRRKNGEGVVRRVLKKQEGERRGVVAKAAGRELFLELWYQSDTVFDAVVNAVPQILGLKQLGTTFRKKRCHRWVTPEITVELCARSLNDMGRALEGSERDQRGALWRRAEEVERGVRSASPSNGSSQNSPVASIVEIESADSFSKKSDPKNALRAGFAHAGRVTQFINPYESELAYRAKMSVLDLLRQLGVQSGLPSPSPKIFRRPLSYAAVWKFEQQENAKRFLPMMLWMNADGSDVRATAPGLGGFLTYPEFLSRLAQRGKATYVSYDDKDNVPGLFRQWLEEVKNGEDLILLAHAQNARGVWPWLTNFRIGLDHLSFERDKDSLLISEWPGLRVVRVRDANNCETPECFAQRECAENETPGPIMSFTQGLFQASERVFYSLTKKPKQRRLLSANTSKALNPDMQAWNPRIVELTVACKQEGDQPWQLAMLAHKLRDAAVNNDDPTILPLPLHLLSAATEYARIGAESR
ncbi:MAG: DUF3962 domain-containing protein [Acidobacteriota bacterium]|nr:DUF3962 domain-containing protein [Acidobacteriota bacterium]